MRFDLEREFADFRIEECQNCGSFRKISTSRLSRWPTWIIIAVPPPKVHSTTSVRSLACLIRLYAMRKSRVQSASWDGLLTSREDRIRRYTKRKRWLPPPAPISARQTVRQTQAGAPEERHRRTTTYVPAPLPWQRRGFADSMQAPPRSAARCREHSPSREQLPESSFRSPIFQNVRRSRPTINLKGWRRLPPRVRRGSGRAGLARIPQYPFGCGGIAFR